MEDERLINLFKVENDLYNNEIEKNKKIWDKRGYCKIDDTGPYKDLYDKMIEKGYCAIDSVRPQIPLNSIIAYISNEGKLYKGRYRYEWQYSRIVLSIYEKTQITWDIKYSDMKHLFIKYEDNLHSNYMLESKNSKGRIFIEGGVSIGIEDVVSIDINRV